MVTAPRPISERSADEGFRYSMIDEVGALGVMDGFLVGEIGRKIVINYTDGTNTTISTVEYHDSGSAIFTLSLTSASGVDTWERIA